MESSINDPNNHVPEVTPEDVWGDAEGLIASHGGVATILPLKKSRSDLNAASPGDRAGEGLRIESKTPLRHSEDSGHQLEVQEIDGSVLRLAPEEPAAPRIPRQFTFHERPVTVREDPLTRGESKEWGKKRKNSLFWILGTGAGVGGLVIVALMLLPAINQSNAARPSQGDAGLVLEPEDNGKDIEALNGMLTRQPEAEQVFRKYASATIVDEVLRTVRDPEAVEPLIRTRPLPQAVSKDWLPPDDTRWSVLNIEGIPYGILEGTLPDYSKFGAYLVLSKNQLQLDWKATTAYGTATFDDLEKNQGDPSEIRARIVTSGFYTNVYPEDEYLSFQLSSPDDSKIVWCYARRDQAACIALSKLFWKGDILESSSEPKKVTVRLARGPTGSLPNQWIAAEVLYPDWITP